MAISISRASKRAATPSSGIVDGRRETTAFDVGGKERIAVLDGIVEAPEAVYALDERRYRRLTRHNDEWLASVKLGAMEEISFDSKDGTRINGFIVKPPDYRPGRRYPTLLWIHGGPVSQYANSFSMPWQIFASHGYVVLGVNPRGSSGAARSSRPRSTPTGATRTRKTCSPQSTTP